MKARHPTYSGVAVMQYVEHFNFKNGTAIEVETETLDGQQFISIDFKDSSDDQIFSCIYFIGLTQQGLMHKREMFLDPEAYPTT